MQKPYRQQRGPGRHGEFKRKYHGKRKHGEAKRPRVLRGVVYAVSEKIKPHAAGYRMHAKILACGEQYQQHDKRDAAADREDLKNAQAATK
jgi:hypothetical protein